MAAPEFESTISDQAVKAPQGFAEWEPIRLLNDSDDDNTSEWAGSGFLVSDLLSNWWYKNAQRCGHCKSIKTLCIYLRNNIYQFGSEVTVELICRKCGKYTLYEGSD